MIVPKLLATLLLLAPPPGCHRSQDREVVHVPVPAPPCPIGELPLPPPIRPEVCGTPPDERVCLTPADSDALFLWARDLLRWAAVAKVCLSSPVTL